MKTFLQIALATAFAITLAGIAGAAEVATVDGGSFSGTITSLTDKAVGVTVGGVKKTIPTEDIVLIKAGQTAAEQKTGRAVLRNGDTIVGEAIGGDAEKIVIRSPAVGTVQVQIADIDTLEFEPPQAAETAPAAAKEREKDELVLANGDHLPGMVAHFGKETLNFECTLGKLDIPFNKVRMVKFAALGKEYKEPNKLLLLVTCTDGTSITGSDAELEAGTFSIDSTLGRKLSFPFNNVSEIRCKNGRITYLSDMDPVEVKETPLFDERPWSYKRDLSVGGKPITLQGKTYRKGIGVHSRCSLSYDLGGQFKQFVSELGIDDEVRQSPGIRDDVLAGGNVEVWIYLDGKEALHVPQVKIGANPVAVNLNVKGARKLTLYVDFGEDLHINDHADWAGARLIR